MNWEAIGAGAIWHPGQRGAEEGIVGVLENTTGDAPLETCQFERTSAPTNSPIAPIASQFIHDSLIENLGELTPRQRFRERWQRALFSRMAIILRMSASI
jgi:hypothetical protein